MHGVPLSVAGIKEASNFATADIDNQRFKEYTVLPDVLTLQDTINTDLVLGFNADARLTDHVTGLINVGKALQDYAPLFDRGSMTINELRAVVRLPVDEFNPAWEQAHITAGQVPVELAGVADLGQTDEEAKAAGERFLGRKLQKPAQAGEAARRPVAAGIERRVCRGRHRGDSGIGAPDPVGDAFRPKGARPHVWPRRPVMAERGGAQCVGNSVRASVRPRPNDFLRRYSLVIRRFREAGPWIFA